MALPNTWHLRTVADSSSKACYVCYKPSTKVLITPDSKDFFYICASHLLDKGFASPIIDEAAELAKREREEMAKEIELVKAEYEEKQAKRKKEKKKDKEKDETKGEKKEEEERDQKIKSIEARGKTDNPPDDTPRVYALHKNFYQMRVDRIRNMELAKRSQQRLKDAAFFPAAPRNDLV